ncbi:MAG: flippase, partial [Methanophagales archaeon]|nr:flippase [Methanophagales archaeon]
MNTIQRIAKNTAALFAAQFVVALLSLVLTIFIARSLGDVIFGKYSFALAFTAIFAVFSDLGYNTLLIRDVARDKSQASKYLNNILCMRALLSLVIFALIVITINLMGYPADTKNVVYLFGIYTLIGSFSAVFKVTFRAFEKMEYEAGITILANLIRVSLGLLVLFLGYGLIELALVFLFSGIFEVLFSFLVCERRFVKPKLEFDFDFWKSTIKVALPLSMLSIFGLIYVRIDTIMLSMMEGDAFVGWYNAAYNLVLGFKPIPRLFLYSLFPLMARHFVSSKDSLKIIYEKSFKYLFILGLPLALGITVLADRFIILFYGEQFYPSIIALQILAWDVLLIFLLSPLGTLLVSINRQNEMAILLGITALVNVILNLIL